MQLSHVSVWLKHYGHGGLQTFYQTSLGQDNSTLQILYQDIYIPDSKQFSLVN